LSRYCFLKFSLMIPNIASQFFDYRHAIGTFGDVLNF
jgi:hypothetical protein